MKQISTLLFIISFSILCIQNTEAQVTPVQNGDIFTLSVGDVELAVDASFGARITSFKLGDKETLIQGRDMTGSTLWTSPQSEWNWPTLPTTDLNAYTGSIEGNKMTFMSGEETGIKSKKFKFIKTIWANEIDSSISINYAMVNTGTSSLKNALWSVTRVQPEGLTFWAVGDKKPWGSTLTNHIEELENYYWLEFAKSNGTGMKFFSDIAGPSWFGHVTGDGHLFLISGKAVASTEFATGEAEMEYWVDGSVGYVELENQSKYVTLAAGDTLHYNVVWHIRRVPADIAIEAGNTALIDFAKKVVATEEQTAVHEVQLTSAKVYPNPANQQLTVEINTDKFTSARFNIHDMTGRILLSKEVSNRTQIDISMLRNGAYFYSIVSDQYEQKGKLIKK
ncbi:MAG: T9SS type A sorting domain-containing protein [Prolixibacteraceae bacterium]